MKLKLILLGLVAMTGLGVIFFHITNNKSSEQISQINPQWQTYIEPNTYSIQHPPNWFVERLRRELVIITSQPPVKKWHGKITS
ncbi:hypothetical protein [Chroogloeocystis siderophila]|uniref:Uncharacterized protein n=1 Tax=Chroogloeocystis siderophila 5.2 s.c.1 TaxID=247279 RepID=A0A1U7HZM6_9CHRO|nr:hypothetical protein [Chroogloeocystis siderophila]OKH29083.1 hypothetical protein NIES1031_00290 [Chroogloeocystis siderophila 5.2 s.c.1]